MVDVTPGNLGANKGHWAKQIRDRYGRFVEEGSEVMIEVELQGVVGKVHGVGIFRGSVEPGVARVEVMDNKKMPRGVYLVKSENLTAIKAILPDAAFEPKAPAVIPKPEPSYSGIDYEAPDFNDITAFQFANAEEEAALLYYTGDPTSNIQEVGHFNINTLLREKKLDWTIKTREQRDQLLERMENLRKVVNSTTLDTDTKVFRWQSRLMPELKEVGAVWESDGFLSTSAGTKDGQDVFTAFTYSSVFIEINLPKGTRGGAVPGSVEAEILLPPGSKFIVQKIEKQDKMTKVTITLVGQMDANERFNDDAFREVTDPQLVEEAEDAANELAIKAESDKL